MPDASYTARHFLLMPTFRRVGACASCSLQNPHCAKLSSLPPSQPLAQIIAIKASTLKGGSNPLSSSHRFGRKSPDTPWVYSWYAETRRHRCKHTCGLLRLSLPFHMPGNGSYCRLHSASALLVLVAGSSLGRLACKGDEDMSPWPGNGD
jgi:hypothetical protein